MIQKIEKDNSNSFDFILVELQKAIRLMKGYDHKNMYFAIQSNFTQSALKNKSYLKQFFRKRKLKNIYNNTNIITCSHDIKNDLLNIIGINPKTIQTIYNPVDLLTIEDLSLKNNIIKEKDYIIHIGRFSYVKRHDILIKAFHKADLDTKLVLVGDGEEKENIIKLIKELKLEDKIILTGFLQNPYPVLKDAKLFVLSSQYEGLPTVLIEALSLNTNIVSTNCKSGPSEIMINNLSNYLIEVNNIKSLSDMIKNTYNNPYTIDEKIIKTFSLKTIIKKYIRLFNDK
jgi:glycosyltransferase involved in cell wall biosynthesis